jgi:hypothetical protein
MRHLPHAALVGNQQTVALPRQAMGPVQILDVPIDPLGVSSAVIAQQRDAYLLIPGLGGQGPMLLEGGRVAAKK